MIDVFVNQDIAFQVTHGTVLQKKALAELLAKEEVKVEGIAPSDRYLPGRS